MFWNRGKREERSVDEIVDIFTTVVSSLEKVVERENEKRKVSSDIIIEEQRKMEVASKERDKAEQFSKNLGALLNG